MQLKDSKVGTFRLSNSTGVIMQYNNNYCTTLVNRYFYN